MRGGALARACPGDDANKDHAVAAAPPRSRLSATNVRPTMRKLCANALDVSSRTVTPTRDWVQVGAEGEGKASSSFTRV